MSGRILIVDDEPNMLRLGEYALKTAGYETLTAETGMKALKLVQTERPDLVILDLMLPDVSGMEVCQQLRAKPETADLPIIMLSARGRVSDKVSGLKAGADEYVTKPVDWDEMVARVSALLERTRRLRTAQPAKLGKVIGFIGAKGGVGTTTVALNVASILAAQKKTVIVGEIRSGYGTLSQQLNLAPVKNLTNLLKLGPRQMSEQELSMALTTFPSGLAVLFGPQKVDQFNEVDPAQANALTTGLTRLADFLIVDLPCYPSGASQAVMHHCDLVVLVVEPEPVCVWSGKITLELLMAWGVSLGRVVAMVVNRAELTMDLGKIRSLLGCEILGVVPPAREVCIAAQKQGLPFVLSHPNHIAAINLTEITNKLVADNITALSMR